MSGISNNSSSNRSGVWSTSRKSASRTRQRRGRRQGRRATNNNCHHDDVMDDLMTTMQCSPIANNNLFQNKIMSQTHGASTSSIGSFASKLNELFACNAVMPTTTHHHHHGLVHHEPLSTRSHQEEEEIECNMMETGFEIDEHVTLKTAYDLYRV
jgi:hypothetical protein